MVEGLRVSYALGLFAWLWASCGGGDDATPANDAGPLSLQDGAAPPNAASVPVADAGHSCAADAGAPTGTIPATFETVKLVLGGGGGIMPCAAAPCHGVNGVAPPDHPLALPANDDAKLYASLTSYVSKACSNTKLVSPCNSSASALVAILKGACGTTPRMPYGCTPEAGDCIPDEYIAAVAQWIARGAPLR